MKKCFIVTDSTDVSTTFELLQRKALYKFVLPLLISIIVVECRYHKLMAVCNLSSKFPPQAPLHIFNYRISIIWTVSIGHLLIMHNLLLNTTSLHGEWRKQNNFSAWRCWISGQHQVSKKILLFVTMWRGWLMWQSQYSLVLLIH